MPRARAPRTGPVLGLSVVVLLLGLLGVVVSAALPAPAQPLPVPFVLIAAAFVALESSRVEVTVSARTVRISLSDAALVIGLSALSPWLLLLAYVVGYAPALVRRRREGAKTFFNAAVSVLFVGAAALAHRAVLQGGVASSPRGWLAALVAVVVATTAGLLAVSAVVAVATRSTRWWEGLREMPAALALSATMGCVGLLCAVAVTVDPLAALLFLGPVGLFAWSYVGYQRLRQSKEGTDALYRFTRSLGATTGVRDAAPVVLREARALLHARTAELVVHVPGNGYLRLRLDSAGSAEELPLEDPLDLPWASGAMGATVCVAPADSGPVADRLKATVGATSLLATPLLHEEEVEGALLVTGSPGPLGFSRDDQSLLEALANHAAVALWGARLVDRLQDEATRRQHEALHDRLTGLPNRRAFTLEVKAEATRLRASEGCFALAILDLDLFKEVNETLGHAVGDRLLREVAERLRTESPGPVARLGGDEFAVLLPGVDDAATALSAAQALVDALRAPVDLGEVKLATTASAGLVLAPQHGRTAGQLLRRADVALYTSKRRGAGPEVYQRQEDATSRRRLDLLAELPHAMHEGQLTVAYQPKAQTATREVVGVEALVRWQSPVFGDIDPTEFVPLAEASGQLPVLTAFVLEETVRQAAAWERAGFALGVAVNISTRALLDERFVDDVAACLARHDLPPERLTLEITEGSVMREVSRSLAMLERIDALGVRLAVDDFGTGWSSLAYLKRLPVDEVKIDRSFVSGMGSDADDAAIVASIVQLAHELGLVVVAEGVEHPAAWEHLTRLGCDQVQGYLLHHPVPADELEAWLGQRRLPSSPRTAELPGRGLAEVRRIPGAREA